MNVPPIPLRVFKSVRDLMEANTHLSQEKDELQRKLSEIESANSRLTETLADKTNNYNDVISMNTSQLREQSEHVNRILSESLFNERNILIAQKDTILQSLDNLTRERDQIAAQRDQFAAQRDQLVAQRDGQRWLVKDADGITLLLDKESLVDLHVFYHNRWEKDRLEYLLLLIEEVGLTQEKPLYFMDIGSYFGQYALVIKTKFAAVNTYCFEANPYNYAQLNANLMLNNLLEHVITYNRCVTDRPGQMNVPVAHGNRGASQVGEAYTGVKQSAFIVNNLIIDEEFKHLNDCMIFMKMDIEGMESHALAGMKELMQRNKVVIQIENWEYANGGSDTILREYGFSLKRGMDPDYFYANFTMDPWPISQP